VTAAVITGLGVAAPNGLGAEKFWSATRADHNGIARITRFDPQQYPVTLAGEVPDFDATQHLPSRLLPQTDHMTRLALVAADEALLDAAFVVDESCALDVGVVTASSAGGFEFGQKELQALWGRGSKHVSAYQSFAWFYAVNSGQISIRHGLRGHSGVLVSEQAGGLDAIGQARRQLRKGATMVVAGGVDGAICPWGLAAQLTSGRLSTGADPDTAYRPFATDACGHVPAEGGALFTVENGAAAAARGAHVYAGVAGYAATFDPPPGSDRPPGLERAIRLALADAGVAADAVDVVFADGAAVPELDRAEARALASVFGPAGVAVCVPKARLGRLAAGGGSLDVACALLAMRDGILPPTSGVVPDDTYELDLVTEARVQPIHTTLVLARGHGGFNSALVLRSGA
jgi:act minimal PKS chain-length factor (CLF/KS beta)